MTKATRWGPLVLATACVHAALWALPAAALELSTHRAVYSMEMLATRAGSELSDVNGKMAIEWLDVCDGWTVTQRVTMTFVPRSGEGFENDFSFSSWESKDGDQFRYTMKTVTNGQLVEEVDGRATRDGGVGTATFTMPSEKVFDLPEGTLFPTEHLFASMAAATAGERVFVRPMFSGTGFDSLNEVAAFISPVIEPGTRPLLGPTDRDAAIMGLADLPSWQVSLAYFPYGAEDSEPEFEVHYRIADNGVAAHLDLDYGDFAIRALLDYLEVRPAPSC